MVFLSIYYLLVPITNGSHGGDDCFDRSGCIIVSKLIAAFLREYKLIKGVNREIVYLKDQMSCVNSLLVSMDGMEELEVQRKIKLRELSFAMEECIRPLQVPPR